jgi:hypothetical protein
MSDKFIRVRLNDELFRKYKVYCALNDRSMTQQTEHIVREFIKVQNEKVKIINVVKD